MTHSNGQPEGVTSGPALPVSDFTLLGPCVICQRSWMARACSQRQHRCLLGRRDCGSVTTGLQPPLGWLAGQGQVLVFSVRFRHGDTMQGLVSLLGNMCI